MADPLSFRWHRAFIDRIDRHRGQVKRSTWIRTVLARELDRLDAVEALDENAPLAQTDAPSPSPPAVPDLTDREFMAHTHRPTCKCAICKPR